MQLHKKGFTLIEIVIVLAIAALIMVLVFAAVQGANRSRRDTSRKNDANRVLALAENFAGTNSGSYPTSGSTCTTFNTLYGAKENLKDPSTGGNYAGFCGQIPSGPVSQGQVYYSAGAQCTGGQMVSSGNQRQFAVQIGLESGTYCVSN